MDSSLYSFSYWGTGTPMGTIPFGKRLLPSVQDLLSSSLLPRNIDFKTQAKELQFCLVFDMCMKLVSHIKGRNTVGDVREQILRKILAP